MLFGETVAVYCENRFRAGATYNNHCAFVRDGRTCADRDPNEPSRTLSLLRRCGAESVEKPQAGQPASISRMERGSSASDVLPADAVPQLLRNR
jgi:hypothetical protein